MSNTGGWRLGALGGMVCAAMAVGGCDENADRQGRGPGAWDGEEPTSDPVDLPTTPVYGGDTVASCGWPTTVSLGGSCTGTLVAPDVVIYAAHCGANYDWIRFGEYAYSGDGRWVSTDRCEIYPGGGPGDGDDFAYCMLSEAVDDVPIVPILMGCETDILQPGQPTTIVGFGNADNGPYGYKRAVTAPIQYQTSSGEIRIGGGGKDSCQGDSGGPVYVQLDDGSWRVFGVTSYGGACGVGGFYSMMHHGMQWFEDRTGRDLTPCHDADGTWNPTEGCGDFPLDPAPGGGAWAQGCGGGDVSGYSATCGEGFAEEDDPVEPPPEEPEEPKGEVFEGSLTSTNDQQLQPDGTYWLAEAGAHEAVLDGAAGTDFDVYLYWWTNGEWRQVASGTSSSSVEQVNYEGAAGYYTWQVRSYSGSGEYALTLTRP